MVSINDAFPNKYLKADDLQGKEVTVTIGGAEIELVGQQKERRLVLYFRGKEKGMVCNKTNAGRIAFFYGDDTDGWVGNQIILYAEMVDFQGKPTWGLRVKAPQGTPTKQHAAAQRMQAPNGGDPRPEPPAAAYTGGGGPLPNDDIPFAACKD